MRILQVVPAFALGGAEESVSIVTAGLARHGHKCCMASVTQRSDKYGIGDHLKERLSLSGAEFFVLGSGNIYVDIPMAAFRLVKLIRQWKPDIVHSNTDIADAAVALARRFKNFRVARTIRNTVLWPTRRYSGFICESAYRDELVIHLSPDTKVAYQDLRRRFRLPESEFQVQIPNCVEAIPEEDYFSRADLIDRYAASENKFQFCFAGRFDPQKGLDVLIEAIATLPVNYLQRTEFHAFGHGEALPAYERRVGETGIPMKIHAPVPGIFRWMPAFDAVVIPSRFEGLSRVALEGMAAGVPVITTTAPGLRNTTPPEWPLAVPTDDPIALGRLIMDFIDGEYDLNNLIEVGRRRVDALYSVDRVIELHDKAYRWFLSV